MARQTVAIRKSLTLDAAPWHSPGALYAGSRSIGIRHCVALLQLLMVGLAGCHSAGACCNPRYVSDSLAGRTGLSVTTVSVRREVIPAGVVLEDGLAEGEAVVTGLANNSLFQAALAQLGMAGGDAVQATLLINPQVLMYFPSGAKEGQYTLYAPIESYFLRPARVKVANREYRRIGDQLVQNGLNVARDLRLAYIELALSHERAALAAEAMELRQGIADLTTKRFSSGDISELETITSRVDALQGTALAAAEQHNIAMALARLVTLMGLPCLPTPIAPEPLRTPAPMELDECRLLETALACRPDYHAASWQIAAATQRSTLARWLFWRVDGVLDVRTGPDYTRSGTGLRLDLPIFNRNQGGVLRADWELNAAIHNRDAIRDQIYQEVRVALRQVEQSRTNLQILETQMLPQLSEAVHIAEKGFADGGTDYLLVLQTNSQYLDARSRVLTERAALRRGLAELERAVSRPLTAEPLDVAEMLLLTAPPADVLSLAAENTHQPETASSPSEVGG